MNAVEFDVTAQLDKFNKAADQTPYILSKALNDIAFKNARKDLSKEIYDKMEVRNKAFANPGSIRINKSSKNNLTIELYHFKEQMGVQQFGGIETPKGKKLAVPIRKNLARYANVPNNKSIPKSLKIDTIMNKAPRKKGEPVYKTKGIKPFITNRGVFVRTSAGIRLIYSFVDKAKHDKKLFQFQKTLEKTYSIKLERNIERNYLKILKG